MVEYALKKDKFTGVILGALRLSIIRLLIPFIIYFAITSRETLALASFLKVLFALMFLYYLMKLIVNLRKVRRDWLTFRIMLSEQTLIKKQNKVPDVTLYLSDITRIVRVAGGLSVESGTVGSHVFIPSHLENYEELIERLRACCVVEESPISSVAVPSDYALKQHLTTHTIWKKLFAGIGIAFGLFMLFILAIVALIYFLSH
ncbi:hypothetical protein A8709_04440 [Paenibacillus pectinilyticus]|uniref:DUF304 domain-containing protein n=1 Tax=Paenibacillus pectinilyticus TaxID=512399 RepID=A0A1C0ZSB4_9BACL|nr:hypothetical protein [Paenibacillus pectinilyticus]OCT10957.1 hypothetical protein A8709_04440 [Paenibacillus pectinilyticus]